MGNKAKLVLKDGRVFEGKSFGAKTSVAGEVVFTTGMVGYEQSLTDPSYYGQILVFTYPLIGNWGVPSPDYWESSKIQVSAVVISDLTTSPHHHLMQKTLNDWLEEEGIPAVVGVDTRALTQELRERGVMLGKVLIDNQDIDFWNPNAENLVAKVSPTELTIHQPNPKSAFRLETRSRRAIRNPKQTQNTNNKNSKRFVHSNFENSDLFRTSKFDIRNSPKIGLLNCGAKETIKRNLLARGITVYELPWNFDPFKNKLPIEGLVISNGPGDPKMAKESIRIIKEAIRRKIPTFGICLGNQLLALAAGGNTYKLKFGHRAQNQPTIEVGRKHCYITTQNHGYAVSERKLPDGFRRWFYNANDNTNEGIIHEKLPFLGIQFHPESTPGPYDTEFLFDYFLNKVRKTT